MKKVEKIFDLAGRKLTLTTGTLAEQATSAVLAKYGDTVVFATVMAAPIKVDLGYFPLTVDYQEKLYAGGRIKGSRWVKREGRPTDDEILSGRLIDRSIRPLFPKEYKKEVQVIVMVLSVDMENDPVVLAGIATSAALAASGMPWDGPVGVIRVGYQDGKYIGNPLMPQQDTSELDLVVSSTDKAVLMVEAGAKEVSEDVVLAGIEFAKKENDKLVDFIADFAKAVGHDKQKVVESKLDAKLVTSIEKKVNTKLATLIKEMANHEGGASMYDQVKNALISEFADIDGSVVAAIFDKIVKHEIRAMILKGTRPDGRKLTEIRPLSALVGVLPRTHGSAIFQRGQTQVLTVATLGAPSMGQLIETAFGEEEKRYMHAYSMPPYSTGEAGRIGSPNRREIGHGALAERALEPVIPSLDKFPYAMRVTSEVMSSNGSTSMASVCGSTLSLMDAGVPLTSPVAGIAMGLIIEDLPAQAGAKSYAVLSDIMGIEDFNGDMDFKVAGTKKGITALQLDVKTLNLTPAILKIALEQSKDARAEVMKAILDALPTSREAVSIYAPKIKVVKVDVAKLGQIIGPGGKTIKKIIAETGAQVEVNDNGNVNISGVDIAGVDKAVAQVEALVKEVVAGEIYDGVVVRIAPFGAFVEILPGKDGMVHVSDMGEEFVSDPNDKVKLGDHVQVRVREIDSMGRINLSMNMDPARDKPKTEKSGGGRRFSDRGGYAPRGRSAGFSRDRRPSGGSGGPHFPTSRFVDTDKKDFNR